MLIRVGFEMVFNMPTPAPMLLMLALRPERDPWVRKPGGLRVEPEVPIDWFVDGYGNRCARMVAPAGRLSIRDDAIVEDSGRTDEFAPHAPQAPVEALPSEVLVYLLASRYCEVDRL